MVTEIHIVSSLYFWTFSQFYVVYVDCHYNMIRFLNLHLCGRELFDCEYHFPLFQSIPVIQPEPLCIPNLVFKCEMFQPERLPF